MENSYKFEVTKTHFDLAVKAEISSNKPMTETCLVAQAVKSVLPRQKLSVGNSAVTFLVGKSPAGESRINYALSKTGQQLVRRFDSGYGLGRRRKMLREALPKTVKMTLETT